MKVTIEASAEESKTPVFKAIQALLSETTVQSVVIREDDKRSKRREYQRRHYRKRKEAEKARTDSAPGPVFPENNVLIFD